MKLSRLPEIDLANIASQPLEARARKLKSFKKGGGSWSYDPARNQMFNIFNPQSPLGLNVQPPSFEKIESEIRKASKWQNQFSSNLEVTKLLYKWAQKNCTTSIERTVPSMPIGSIGTVRYWYNLATIYGNRPTFFFLDHRRKNGLTEEGKRFVFSMMHEQIRMTDPDFSDAQLLILQFPTLKDGKRKVKPTTDSDTQLFSIEELQERISQTYKIFEDVHKSGDKKAA